jgi:hypothetical protein
VEELVCLVSRQLRERHVVRHSRVVDEHREILGRAHFRDCFYPGVSAKVSEEGTHADGWELCDEFLEPVAAPAHDHEVVPFGSEPSGKGPTDAGGGAGDEGQAGEAATTRCVRLKSHSLTFLSRSHRRISGGSTVDFPSGDFPRRLGDMRWSQLRPASLRRPEGSLQAGSSSRDTTRCARPQRARQRYNGARGCDGHQLEVITRPYGSGVG